MCALFLGSPGGASAQTTPFVPVDDPAYRELDALLSAGWASGLTLGQRPYSRLAFARAVLAARARAADGGMDARPRLREAVDRLAGKFAREVESLQLGGVGGPPRSGSPPFTLRGLRADLTGASSPSRTIRTQLKSSVDATVNPLLQRNQGRQLADGVTAGAEVWVDLALGSRVVGHLRPRAYALRTRTDRETAQVDLVDGYLRALLGNLSVELGRNRITRGHAPFNAPVLSGNARGLDNLRLSMERPARLPWILGALGPFMASALVADMGDGSDTPGSKMVVFQGSFRPHPSLELGGALLNHQGGGVGPEVSLGERLRDVFFLVRRRPIFWFPKATVASDKALGLDARLSIPRWGMDLSVEMLTTDDHNVFLAPGQALWNDAAWTGAARMSGLGADGRFDLWMEWSRVGLLPYTHHQFTSGLAVDGRILGSPMGPLGTGVQGGLDWNGTAHTLSLTGAWERYAGDTYRNPDDGLSRRFRTADNPDEIRLRAEVAWIHAPGALGLRSTVRVGGEHVTRLALTDVNRFNAIAQVRLDYVW